MGADWYTFRVLYGIKVPIDKVRLLHEALVDNDKKCLKGFTDEFPVTVKLYETKTHTRTEDEDREYTMYRCVGFLGVICTSVSREQVCGFDEALGEYLNQHDQLLRGLGVLDRSPRVYGGIYRAVCTFWDIESEDDLIQYRRLEAEGERELERFRALK